ncbi:MAG: hypothetical protein QW597_00790 [Thermoplasmataceae archaeon]
MKVRKLSLWLSLISLGSVVAAFYFGHSSGYLLYEKSVFLESIEIIAPALVFPFVVSLEYPRIRTLQFYFSLLTMLYYALLASVFVYVPNIDIFLIISLAANVYIFYKYAYEGKVSIYRASIFYAVFFLMFYLSGLMRIYFVPSFSPVMYVGSIYDDENPAGVPAFFAGSLVIYSRLFVLTISSQTLALFAGLSSVLTENYTLIFRYVRKRASTSAFSGTLSGALSVLSCQCEGITAAFPTAVTLLISVMVIPLILESIVLLAMTNIFLLVFYIKGRRLRLKLILLHKKTVSPYVLSAVFLILVPLLETTGIYYGMERNLFFFVSINLVMFIEGITISTIISTVVRFRKIGTLFVYIMSIMSFCLMFSWFIPAVSVYAYTYVEWFSVMTFSSLAAGVITGYVYGTLDPNQKRVYLEFITMMFSMFAIVLFYITVIGNVVLWKGISGIGEQSTLAIAIWMVSLPVMWIATNVSLNSYGDNHAARSQA